MAARVIVGLFGVMLTDAKKAKDSALPFSVKYLYPRNF